MKKIFLLTLFLFLIITFLSFTIFLNNDEPKVTKNEFENISFYKKEYLERYINYKNSNPNLNNNDIVTLVNLELDKEDYTNTKESKLINRTDILINKHYYLPSNYIPNNLVRINNTDKFLIKEAKEWLEKMLIDINNNNLTLRIISSYRPYDYQKKLYNNYVKKDGIELADTYSARPGFSEHQTGLVIDVDNGKTNYEQFATTKEYQWMINNCYKYGFILRYPKGKENITRYNYESWHYRYVGINIAKYIHDHDITFDEYYIRFIEK